MHLIANAPLFEKSEFRLFAMLSEKDLQHLKPARINLSGCKRTPKGTIGLPIMLTIPEPALPLQWTQFPEPVFNLLTR